MSMKKQYQSLQKELEVVRKEQALLQERELDLKQKLDIIEYMCEKDGGHEWINKTFTYRNDIGHNLIQKECNRCGYVDIKWDFLLKRESEQNEKQKIKE